MSDRIRCRARSSLWFLFFGGTNNKTVAAKKCDRTERNGRWRQCYWWRYRDAVNKMDSWLSNHKMMINWVSLIVAVHTWFLWVPRWCFFLDAADGGRPNWGAAEDKSQRAWAFPLFCDEPAFYWSEYMGALPLSLIAEAFCTCDFLGGAKSLSFLWM